MLKEGDIILSELAMSYMGYSAKIGHPVSIGRPTGTVQRPSSRTWSWPASRTVEALVQARHHARRRAQGGRQAFRKRGAQSRPTIMHGLDLITSVPFITADRVRAEPYDMTMQPGMTYNIEITPVDKDGIFGIF